MPPRTSIPRIRLYTTQTLEAGAPVSIEDKQAHYLLHVMRVKEGQAIHLFNNAAGEWYSEVTHRGKKTITVEVREQTRPHYTPKKVGLIFVPIKAGAIEVMIEKATELGVTDFYPILSSHSSVPRINQERLQLRAIEAAEQSERVDIPTVHPLSDIERLLSTWDAATPIFYGDEAGNSASINTILSNDAPEQWAVMVGPEGGFAIQEFRLLHAHAAATGVGLGPRILRAETASTTLLALTQCAWGDWHIAPSFRHDAA